MNTHDDPQFGNVWTFCAIDTDTKLVPAFRVGKDRDVHTATAFVLDVADRMKNRVQISTDGVESMHVDSVPVKETFQGRTIWDGVVEVFDLIAHPSSTRSYTWSHQTDDPKRPRRHVTVLHTDPVISPLTAVRAVIIQEFRGNAPAEA